jgi:hypothetical protein
VRGILPPRLYGVVFRRWGLLRGQSVKMLNEGHDPVVWGRGIAVLVMTCECQWHSCVRARNTAYYMLCVLYTYLLISAVWDPPLGSCVTESTARTECIFL